MCCQRHCPACRVPCTTSSSENSGSSVRSLGSKRASKQGSKQGSKRAEYTLDNDFAEKSRVVTSGIPSRFQGSKQQFYKRTRKILEHAILFSADLDNNSRIAIWKSSNIPSSFQGSKPQCWQINLLLLQRWNTWTTSIVLYARVDLL